MKFSISIGDSKSVIIETPSKVFTYKAQLTSLDAIPTTKFILAKRIYTYHKLYNSVVFIQKNIIIP